MKWYCAINEAGLLRYGQMIAAACNSAKKNTSLKPHLLYDGQPNYFVDQLQKEGVTVHYTRVAFYEDLLASKAGGGFNPEVARGAYLRLEVTNIEKTDEFVLYTDVDVLFTTDPNLMEIRPLNFAACPEVWTGGAQPSYVNTVFNSGVMVINVPALRQSYAELVSVGKEHGFYFHGRAGFYDQGLLNLFYAQNWEPLNARLNCRPFIGDITTGQILHFHGTKPYEIELMQRGEHVKVPEAGQKLYGWAPQAYNKLLNDFRASVPDWWWEYRNSASEPAFGVERQSG